MVRPSTNVTIFSETPKQTTALPAEVQTGGYQNNQVITAGEYNLLMSTIQKWVKYLDEERKKGVNTDTSLQTFITALQNRATSLETSRTNRMGEIVTTISTHRPLDCLPCNGSVYAKADFSDFITYAVDKGYFADIGGESQAIFGTEGWGKLIHGGHSITGTQFYVPKLQGLFLRMTGLGTNPLGRYQVDELRAHSHQIWGDINVGLGGSGRLGTMQQQGFEAWINTENTGGNETRPKNMAVNFWIRYK